MTGTAMYGREQNEVRLVERKMPGNDNVWIIFGVSVSVNNIFIDKLTWRTSACKLIKIIVIRKRTTSMPHN